MKTEKFILTSAVLLLALAVPMALLINAQDQSSGNTQSGPATQAGSYRLSGPYTHKNLSIFLIHGKSIVLSKNFLTLQEALEQKKVIVYETKTVSELAIENVSN